VPSLNLQPNHKPIRDYYAALSQLSLLHTTHEGAVRSAFGTLLQACAQQHKWTLVNEYEIRRKEKLLRVDGAIVDPWSLTHGFWEAKDQRDDLAVEAKKKIDLGYPTENIVFQAPDRAILYQGGKRILDEPLREPQVLVDVVKEFFRYEPPHYEEWEKAVADFKDRVPDLARALEKLIEKERTYPHFKAAFDNFALVCRASLNPRLSDDSVEKMLVQHILTERIFRKVFENPDFVRRNPIAVEIEKVIDKLTQRSFSREKFLGGLDRFYSAIEGTASSIEEFSEKQTFLNAVYEQFFQGFDAKTADTHGIVYTPQPIVRFMVRSVDEILRREFGTSLGDKGVHILDPFVGTGNFLLSVMRHIPKTRLPQKYARELHANEMMLLPYYIASMNIEHEYVELTREYKPFEGLCLVDTFELAEPAQAAFAVMTEKNTQRVEAQKKAPITVIIGNPPYNAWQLDENDGNRNRKYETVDKRVGETYSKSSRATLVNSLSDPYVKALRWASDRIGEEGVLAYVTNSSYVSQFAFDGVRQHLASDFDAIYVVDLGGNIRKNPKLSGTTHNVFGIQLGVAIGFFVRRKTASRVGRKAEIFYARVEEDWRKEQKYKFLDDVGDVAKIEWRRLEPDARHTWLTEGLREEYDSFVPLAADAKRGEEPEAIFTLVSNGIKSNNDAYVFGFSREKVATRAQSMVDAYNAELLRWRAAKAKQDVSSFIRVDERVLKWVRKTKQHLARGNPAEFDDESIVEALYRPFTRNYLFFDRMFSEDTYQLDHLWGAGRKNLAIVVKTGSEWPMFALACDCISEQLPQGGSRVFAFYRFSDSDVGCDNITDWVLNQFCKRYGDARIAKIDIFNYVYAVLHHPEYRARYRENLKRELPRVPFVSGFWEFASVGRSLVRLHLEYEQQSEFPLRRLESPTAPLDLRVEKMKLSRDKKQLIYNDFLTLDGIPPEVFTYRLGNRSALEWIVDQYQVSTDRRSGIVNDPNRTEDPEYVLRLVGQVITVSLETMKLVRSLPPLGGGDADRTTMSTPTTKLSDQVAEIKALGKGWHEPDTPAPDARTIEQFGRFLALAVDAANISDPFLYATPEGGAQAEWPLGDWVVEASVQPGMGEVLLHATELQGHGDEETILRLKDKRAPEAFAEFIRKLGTKGNPSGGRYAGHA